MAKASWAGKVIAESNATVVVEGNRYFPARKCQRGIPEAQQSHKLSCPWKGNARYFPMSPSTACRTRTQLGTTPEPKARGRANQGAHRFFGMASTSRTDPPPRSPASSYFAILIFEDRPVVHHKPHVLQFAGVLQRIS